MRTRRPGGIGRLPGLARTLNERDRASRTSQTDLPQTGPAQAGVNASIGIPGLDSLFATLRDAMERLGQAGSGEKTIEIGGQEGRMVFGYSVRVGADGGAEPFGNVAEGGGTPETGAPRQPIIDIQTDAVDIVVIAEVPGLAETDVTVALQARTLLISAAGWRKQIELPEPVVPGSLRRSCRNGILEVRMTRETP